MPQEQVSQPASQQTGYIGENSFRGCALPGTGTAEKTLGKSVAPKNKVGALCFLSDAFFGSLSFLLPGQVSAGMLKLF